MKHGPRAVALSFGLMSLSAMPAAAQAWLFPYYAIPIAAAGTSSTFVAGSYGRGLNDDSGKSDAFGAAIGNAGEAVSFVGSAGIVSVGGEQELTLGGGVGVAVSSSESAAIAVQGGIGWLADETLDETFTSLRFPVGVSVQGRVRTPEVSITPWVMPRVEIVWFSGAGDSTSDAELAASGGVSFNFPSGVGVHTALDVVFADGGKPVLFGIGGHFTIGGGAG